MDTKDTYDAVVVGSGTAGQTAAFHLKEKGLNVALVEKSDHPGGTCALAGCQPKKWFYEVAEAIAKSRDLMGKGIVISAEGSWRRVFEQKQRFTSSVPQKTIKQLKDAGIAFLPGTAAFIDEKTLSVNKEKIQSRFFVLAVGAKPMALPIDGNEHVITSSQFLELKILPSSIVFIGGGFISFEFAHFAARLGSDRQRSVIVEVGDRPLGPFDAEMVEVLVAASQLENIDVRCGVQIKRIEKTEKGFFLQTAEGEGFETDLVVHGAGRVPDLDDLGLDIAGVGYSKQGITVDAAMRTTNPRIFAAGDCAATIALARVADQEAFVAANNILAELDRGPDAAMDYRTVPSILFTIPQLAMVGQTEASLKQDNRTYHKSAAKNLNWPTYWRVGLEHAAYKILTDEKNRILGAHILSDQASGLINTIKQAMINDTPADELYRQTLVSPYPTRESDLSYMLEPLLKG